MGHIPVLIEQVVRLLEPKPGQTAVDCTLGLGGHAAALIPHLAPGGRYIGLDVDSGNLHTAQQRLAPIAAQAQVRLELVHANFRDLRQVLTDHDIPGIDLLLADLGFASVQMDDPERGFSFAADGPLDMRLDPGATVTAADLVNHLGERELADLIFQFGEERLSRKIARKIIETRQESPIHTTRELAELVRRAYGPRGRGSRIDPATRTFMALRIAVNGELDALDDLLAALPTCLNPGGRAGVISFHSLEDRRVKQAFVATTKEGDFTRVTKKPLTAAEAEREENPRSRSAKFRVIRRHDGDRVH